MRDVVSEIIDYNRVLRDETHKVIDEGGADLTSEAMRRKLQALARSPFAFFRGTFHLMCRDLLLERVPHAKASAPGGLIVGDLHLENFGVYRGALGELCFDVNDFDDVGFGPIDLDLKRLCTSALLLDGVGHAACMSAAKAAANAWAETVQRLGGRFPVAPFDLAKAETPVKELLVEHKGRTREQLIAKAAPEKNHLTFTTAGEPRKWAHVGKAWVHQVEQALVEYLESLRQLKVDVSHTWSVLDVAYRFKGTGSLGRLRFQALLGRGDERRIVEIKEARPSVIDEVRGRRTPKERARVQTAAIRRLQGSPWPRVAGTHLGKVSSLCREIQAEEEKLGSDRFSAGQGDTNHELLKSYARQCGEVLARLHSRENAPLMLDDGEFDPEETAKQAVAFAEGYAAQVIADQKAFLKEQERVAKALGL